MTDVEKRPGSTPAIAMVVVILLILGLGLYFLAGRNTAESDKTLAEAASVDTAALHQQSISGGSELSSRGLGAGIPVRDVSLFEGRDIHDVPLGVILDYAQRLPYDDTRGHERTLARNDHGQTVHVKIWPEAGASSMEAATLRQGRIVARIESDGAYDDLGLADGLNYLWIEARPGGGYRGVIIPATAFAPLHDLDRVSITERTPEGVPLEKGAYWVDGQPWIACGRC